jgi:transposase
LTPASYERRRKSIERRWEALLLKIIRRRRNSPEMQRLIDHIGNHYDAWLVFLREPEVPPTNNHAERMLRPAVITRKVGGCNKTLLGALVHSVLASLMATCHQQGRKFLDLARQLWSSDQPQAIPLTPPPFKKPPSVSA